MEALQAVLRLIEKKSWEEMIEKIKEDPSLAFSSLTGASLSSSSSQGNLALHEVCKYQTPLPVIEALLHANPDAVRTRGQWGYLPLHYACASGASHLVVEMLIDAYPAGTRTRDDHEEMLPLHLAAKWGASEAVLLAIMSTHPEGYIFRASSGKTPMDYAQNIPTVAVKQQVIKTLELAPILCSVSKAAQRRATEMTDNRLKGITEAHSSHIQNLEQRRQKEILECKELEETLRSQLDDANKRLEPYKARLEAVEKWVNSLALSMASWSVDKDSVEIKGR